MEVVCGLHYQVVVVYSKDESECNAQTDYQLAADVHYYYY